MKILMVVPARSGSRRAKDKNIRDLGGRPLIAWSLFAAAEAQRKLGEERHTSVCIVSTDSPTYAGIAQDSYEKACRKNGMVWVDCIPFLRPQEISDDCDTGFVVKHAFEWMRDKADFDVDLVVTLQPTSPFRSADDIVNCVHDAVSSKADTVFTVKLLEQYPQWAFMRDIGPPGLGARSWLGIPHRYLSGIIAQDLPELWFPTGSVYCTTRKFIQQGRIYGDRLSMVPVRDSVRSADIETEQDLEYCQFLIDRGLVKC